MSTTHTFTTIGGKRKTADLTPMGAIRAKCIECVQSVYAVADCGGEHCALYPYRLGKRPEAGDAQAVEG